MLSRCLYKVALLFLALFPSCAATNTLYNTKHDLSPYDFGLAKAKTGIECYQVLYETHTAAVSAGVNVDYSGIKAICIEVPDNAKYIPLTRYNDFKGCVFEVKNVAKNHRLFYYAAKETPISISKQRIDTGDFHSIEPLNKGRYLLIIEDENPWVFKRIGHDYGHQRKDILLVENGRANNSVTMPYNNQYSSPKCQYITLDDTPFVFKNITIERKSGCTFLTHVAYISGTDNVQIANVKIHTPASGLMNDRGIMIYNCTNVTMDNICVDGTYSQLNHSGYGFTLNNIWNLKVTNMYGNANWGVFGDNNINVATFEDSQINRFDIHCYGRDIAFKNVEFFNLYNQFASVYGTISYKGCTFTNFVPVLNGGSYNSFVEHDVVFEDCVFNASAEKYFLVKFSHLNGSRNSRHELADKCLPNITIKNMTVNMRGGAKELLLFSCSSVGKELKDIGGLSKIEINGMKINTEGPTVFSRISLSNVKMQTKTVVDCQMQDVEVVQPEVTKAKPVSSNHNTTILKTNLPIKDGKVKMKNVLNVKQ